LIFSKNVILFEPTQNLQTVSHVYVKNDDYDDENPLRVFYSHKDKHFDVIYTMDYVERLAESQGEVHRIVNCLFVNEKSFSYRVQHPVYGRIQAS
jgi:hypothetical protein